MKKKYRYSSLKVIINKNPDPKSKLAKILNMSDVEISDFKVIKRSIDSRKKEICYVYNLEFSTSKKLNIKKISNLTYFEEPILSNTKLNLDQNKKIAIIGYGPAGLFTALYLSENGYMVDIYERGENIEEREKDIANFLDNKSLNLESNIQFGAGGAGTYSDGKLTSRSKDPLSKIVMDYFIQAGADPTIAYDTYPHLGSDKLIEYINYFTKLLHNRGSNIYFNSKLTNIDLEGDFVKNIYINGEVKQYDNIVLAIGHSARDTFEMLNKTNIHLEQKSFALGFRIEHPQEMIDLQQYYHQDNINILGRASYKLRSKISDTHSVYSFCMCPGGIVVNASTEEGMLCSNGMSNYYRDESNANSAIVINVHEEELGNQLFSGLNFQRELEKKAFILGGSDYRAPVQNTVDFIEKKKSEKLVLEPSFTSGYKIEDLSALFPTEMYKNFVKALLDFDKKIPNFIEKSVITGIETRTSSPVRISRNEYFESISAKNLYPVGEGAGYSGGIVSSAIEGLKVAKVLINKK